MASSGPRSPGTVANLAGRGGGAAAWVNPGNAAASDDVYAVSNTGGLAVGTEDLVASNFGFTLASDAAIDGVVAEVEMKSSGGTPLMRGRWSLTPGTIAGASPAPTPATVNISAAEAYHTFGSPTDLDRAWTPANINDANFNFQLRTNGAISNVISADHVRVTVYYHIVHAAAASLAALATITPAPTRTTHAAASMAAVATLTAVAQVTRQAQVSLSSEATLTAATEVTHAAAVAMAAVATLTALGGRTMHAQASLGAQATLTAAGLLTLTGAVLMSCVATLTATWTLRSNTPQPPAGSARATLTPGRGTAGAGIRPRPATAELRRLGDG